MAAYLPQMFDDGVEAERFRPVRTGLLLALFLAFVLGYAWFEKNRPLIGQISARPYARPSACPVRDYSNDRYIYRGCADPAHLLPAYPLGLTQLNMGRHTHYWYRIDNDAYDIDCPQLGNSCTTIAVVKNMFVPKLPRPRLYYYYMAHGL